MSEPSKTWWYGGCEVDAPVMTTGPGWPGSDAEGRKMFENTHFATEAAAWKNLLANAQAGQRLDASAYRQAQAALERATRELATSAARASDLERAHEEWLRAKKEAGRG